MLAAMAAPLLWLGLYPQPLFNAVRPSLRRPAAARRARAGAAAAIRPGRRTVAAAAALRRRPRAQAPAPRSRRPRPPPEAVAVTARDVVTLLPIIALTLSAVVVMLAGTFHTSHRLTVGPHAGRARLDRWPCCPIAAARGGRQVTALLLLDDYTLFFIGLLVLTTAGVVLISYGYLERREQHPHDYYTLLLLATLGGAALVASTHFASFFLGLEVLSVSLYTLIAYPRLRAGFIEAGVKYLVLAAATAAFLLFGMALIYAELGTMSLNAFAHLHVTGGGAGRDLAAHRRLRPDHRRHRLQARRRALPHVDARRLPGRARRR